MLYLLLLTYACILTFPYIISNVCQIAEKVENPLFAINYMQIFINDYAKNFVYEFYVLETTLKNK